MTTTEINIVTADTFKSAEMFTIAGSAIKIERRATLCGIPAIFHLEGDRSKWKHDASSERDRDTSKYHQVDPTRGSSMAATMPSIELVNSSGNPYVAAKEGVEYDTKDAWKAYQWIPNKVWAVLAKSKEPATAASIAAAISKASPKASQIKHFDLTVSDVLRDLSLYGLASRNTVKHNVSKSLYKATDPKEVKLINQE